MKERYDAIVKELKERPEVFHKDGGSYFIEFMPLIEKALKEKVPEKPQKAPEPPKKNKTEEGLVKSMKAAVKKSEKSPAKKKVIVAGKLKKKK
jgi:hypothetical protein